MRGISHGSSGFPRKFLQFGTRDFRDGGVVSATVTMTGKLSRSALAAGWLAVLAVAAFFRFDDAGRRPFHADEATGARLTALRMEGVGGGFDPTHFHGPLLGDAAAAVCRLRGENTWPEMTKGTLRLLPAIAGMVLVAAPLLGRRRFGAVPMLAAGALLAVSPLLVTYSRMFIHEMLLAAFGILFVLSIGSRGARWLPGVLAGLMFATKETVAISLISWGAAAVLVHRKKIAAGIGNPRPWRGVALTNLAAAGVVAAVFYTRFFTRPEGIIDAVATFFRYETGAGHAKSVWYYAKLTIIPVKSGGIWWFATPVFLLALLGAWRGFARGFQAGRFLAWSALFHFAIYGVIGYKTPWLLCLPWAHVCLLAGLAFREIHQAPRAVRWVAPLLTGAAITTQAVQARHIIGRIESDPRNPFAYVPTRRDVETITGWLGELRQTAPPGPLAVIGRDIWPLPWYLRDFRCGYWVELPGNTADFPVIITVPSQGELQADALAGTHVPFPRGLRDGVPMIVWLRKDVWENWLAE